MGLPIISLYLHQNGKRMTLRIKEICKEKQTTMAEVAAKIGISPITLSQSLNGNPTLSRLQEVACILDVSIAELFEKPIKKDFFGCLYVNGKPHIVNSKEEILTLLENS